MTDDGQRHPQPRHADPPRPEIPSHLPVKQDIPRPRILYLTLTLLLMSVAAFVPYTVMAVTKTAEIRSKLEDEMATRSPDYSASDVETAVTIFLVGIVAISLALMVAEIRAMQQVRRKVRGGRTWLVVLTALHVPVIAMTPYVRDGGQGDLRSALVQGACLVLATSLLFASQVTRWLLTVRRQGPIPLRPSAERQSEERQR